MSWFIFLPLFPLLAHSIPPEYPPPLATIPLYTSDNSHYAQISIGTPPQRQSVIIDTGSFYTAFPCSDCPSCSAKLDPPFNDHESSTGLEVNCGQCENKKKAHCEDDHCVFSQAYAEGSSWSAIQFEDFLTLGSLSIFFVVGCQTVETGLFRTQAVDGIMGLAAHEHGLMEHIEDPVRRVFSLCFRDTGGHMTVGGVDSSHHEEPVKFVDLHMQRGHYSLRVADVLLNGRSIADGAAVAVFNKGKGVLVDSGTTDTYLPSIVKAAFQREWRRATGGEERHDNGKREVSRLEFEKLPTLTFVFEGGVQFDVSPSNYMEIDKEAGHYTSRIYVEEDEGAVLGANAMAYHNFVFDARNKRLGFAKSACL